MHSLSGFWSDEALHGYLNVKVSRVRVKDGLQELWHFTDETVMTLNRNNRTSTTDMCFCNSKNKSTYQLPILWSHNMGKHVPLKLWSESKEMLRTNILNYQHPDRS